MPQALTISYIWTFVRDRILFSGSPRLARLIPWNKREHHLCIFQLKVLSAYIAYWNAVIIYMSMWSPYVSQLVLGLVERGAVSAGIGTMALHRVRLICLVCAFGAITLPTHSMTIVDAIGRYAPQVRAMAADFHGFVLLVLKVTGWWRRSAWKMVMEIEVPKWYR